MGVYQPILEGSEEVCANQIFEIINASGVCLRIFESGSLRYELGILAKLSASVVLPGRKASRSLVISKARYVPVLW